jgi:FkbM family methyltransferase
MESVLSKHDKSVLYDEHGNYIPHHVIERDEQLDAFIYLPSDSTVLELGARYGMVSCLISKILKNPQNHVAVEPDTAVIPALTKNRDSTGGKFHIYNGIVSKTPMNFTPFGLGSFVNNVAIGDVGNVQYTSIEELEKKYQIKFDALIADCEGSILKFIEENDISNFRIILLEKDRTDICDYDKVETHFNNCGFLRITNKVDPQFKEVFRSVYVNTNKLLFNILSYKTAHGNIGLFGKLGYDGIETTNVIIDEKDVDTISLHAPSSIIIENKEELLIMGYCSPTSKSSPIMTFKCNNDVVGTISRSSDKTNYHLLDPGTHNLTIDVNNNEWAHSVWVVKPVKKSIRIDLADPGPGLFNQINNLINGLLIGHKTNRDVFDSKFLPDYRSIDSVPISTVIDVDHLNQFLTDLNLNVQINTDKNLDKSNWVKPHYYGFIYNISNNLNEISKIISQEKHSYLSIGWCFSLVLQTDEDIKKIEFEIYKNLRFRSEYYEVFNYCKDKYLGQKHNVVHLRLEDDLINHGKGELSFEQYSQNLFDKYAKAMDSLFSKDEIIYIASHLHKGQNKNNYMTDELKQKYPNIIMSIPWRNLFNLPVGREIDGIIDYLICINAEKFIGLGGSTFSMITGRILTTKNKPIMMI